MNQIYRHHDWKPEYQIREHSIRECGTCGIRRVVGYSMWVGKVVIRYTRHGFTVENLQPLPPSCPYSGGPLR